MASPPELDKTDRLSREADDFADDVAAHRIDDARELGEQPVAGRLYDPLAVLGDARPNQLGAAGRERSERAFLASRMSRP